MLGDDSCDYYTEPIGNDHRDAYFFMEKLERVRRR